MPPKSTRSKPKKKVVLKTPGPAIPPASTVDPTNKKALSYNNKDREKIINLNQKLDEKKKEHDLQVRETKGTIKFLRKENERLIRKQNMKFGTTLDMVDDIKTSLINVKATNVDLFKEMGETKELHDKLESELKEVQRKFKDTLALIGKFKKESKQWVVTDEKLIKSEARCQKLTETNKRLKDLLLQNHIDPNTDVHELIREEHALRDRQSPYSDKAFPRKPKRTMIVKGRYGSMDDLGVLTTAVRDKYDFKEGYGFLNNALFQISPAYLGFYKRGKGKKYDFKQDIEIYRPGVILPKIVVNGGKRRAKYF